MPHFSRAIPANQTEKPNVSGPPSTMLAEHQNNMGSAHRVFWASHAVFYVLLLIKPKLVHKNISQEMK